MALWRLINEVQKQGRFLALVLFLQGVTSGCRVNTTPRPPSEVTDNGGASRGHPPEKPPRGDARVAEARDAEPASTPLDDAAGRLVRPSLGVPKGAASGSGDRREAAPFRRCQAVSEAGDQVVMVPERASPELPVRIVAVTRRADVSGLDLMVSAADGSSVSPERDETWGFHPAALSAYFSRLPSGPYRAALRDRSAGRDLACLAFEVPASPPEPFSSPGSGVWETTHDWTAAYEDLYSVFVSKLFYVPPGGKKGWRPLHQATRDPFRNILYGVLGLDEDQEASPQPVSLESDCADAPYQLRAYFAWKMGLPFMFNQCNRGSALTGPECYATHGNWTRRFNAIAHPVARFNAFVATHVGWKVHSGNGRTLPGAEAGDLYPVPLSADAIRPGAVFVDAGGHLILVSQVEPQTEGGMGAVYGVDAHPDLTVTHKQFGRGTFVFNHRVPTDGFKYFRPVVREGDRLRFLGNDELARAGFPAWSSVQSEVESTASFYDQVHRLLNPVPLEPLSVLENKLGVLYTAMLERVEAVAMGVAYMNETNWREMAMPDGAAIFQTVGPWEIYSTPARDLRLFLAIDDVMTFPERVVGDVDRYDIPAGTEPEQLLAALSAARDEGLRDRAVTYERSDGSLWTLTLAEVIDRQALLEMAYNPNDCVEIRWGASRQSEEMATCRRKAPPAQRFKMKLARRWFASRRRPDQR